MQNLEEIKSKLEAKLRALNERAEEIDDDLSEAPDADWAENASESQDDEVLEAVGEVALDEIQSIKRALARIKDGKYGVCVACGKPIPEGRLEALPYATNCVKCA